jgi:hypothetical protein
VPTPVPGEGKVLVKADTIGVSMPEVLVRRGTYAWMPPLPAIPGIELSGTVTHCRRLRSIARWTIAVVRSQANLLCSWLWEQHGRMGGRLKTK